jgi:cyclic pyranopterin phosphate synthase
MLRDSYDRIINYLRVSVTDRCNLRCSYCVDKDFPFIPHDEILRYEEIIRFVHIVAGLGVRKVRLTGGEPLRRKEITFLLEEFRRMNGIEDISLTTNGVYLAEQIPQLKEAGLTRVNISLDTLKREKFSVITGVDAFEQVMAGIIRAREAGLNPVKINTVLIKDFNDDEVFDFVDFAKALGLHVRFIELMPFGPAGLYDASKTISSRELKELIDGRHELTPSINSDRGPASMYSINGSEGKVGFISPMSTHICHECNRIRLTPDGHLKPCLFSDEEYNVKALLRGGATDDEIRLFTADVVKAKPERKAETGQIKKCQRSMRNIGG